MSERGFSSLQTAAVWRLKTDLASESVSEGELNPIAPTRALCFNICSLSVWDTDFPSSGSHLLKRPLTSDPFA